MTRQNLNAARFILFLIAFASFAPTAWAGDILHHNDPAKILGPENCEECHSPMADVWKLTHHYTGFGTMHRSSQARDIARQMGIRRIKESSLCMDCHYTAQAGDNGNITAIAGVSCESCHGASKDWNNVHNAKGDPNRLSKAEKLGMLRPSNYYAIAKNCFGCHAIADEKLVNVGGHSSGGDFELVSWLSGEVRHNFLKSHGKVNEEIPPARQRTLYLTGRALDLEYSVRGLAQATEDGSYFQAMLARVKTAQSRLADIQKTINLPEVKTMLDAISAPDLKINNAAALIKIADALSKESRGLADSNDGGKLVGLDGLIPVPEKYIGKVYNP